MGQPIENFELLQREMVVLAETKGFTHPDVLTISRQLDQLVVQIQREYIKSSDQKRNTATNSVRN